MKSSDTILEIVGWLIIAGGISLIAVIGSYIIYAIFPNQMGAMMAIGGRVTGFIIGVLYASNIWQKYGTMQWLSDIRKKL
jgi:membrane associated rhomboid family serine protease